MSFSFLQTKDHLIGLGHGSTLNKVRNIEAMYERVASVFLQKCKPLETIRLGTLTQTIHDDVYNYSLPTDYGSLIDLLPQDNRDSWDMAFRKNGENFDLTKATKDKTVSIEGAEGSKIIRINWRSRSPKTLNTMNSLTSNGTWSTVGTATGLKANDIFKVSGSASIEFDSAASGDGIQNTSMTAVDLTDEDEVADVYFWVYLGSTANITSITVYWGNDLTTAYWTSTAITTQADGTAFKAGWNQVKAAWSTATETGTVDPTTIDSFKVTLATTGAIANIRIDNITFSIGRNFDIKYYTKFLFKSSAGVYKTQPTSDDDTVLIDNDSLPLFLFECLKAMAHQVEGTDSAFDLQYAANELAELYPSFRTEYPDQRKKVTDRTTSGPRFQR